MSERAAELTSGRRGRKAAAAVLLALLALGGLSACRNDAGSAAYVGNTRITQDYVNNTVASVDAAALEKVQFSQDTARKFVAEYATFNALASRYAKEKGYKTPTVDPTQVAAIAKALNIPADKINTNPFVKVVAEASAWNNLLQSKAPTVATTDADYRQIYGDLLQSGAIPSSVTYDSIKSGLAQALPDVGTTNALRNDLDAAAKRYGVSVNPRYAGMCVAVHCDGLAFSLGGIPQQSGSIPVLFVNMGGTGTPAVFDVPTPQATGSGAQ